jgi:Uma2 family endonuclease
MVATQSQSPPAVSRRLITVDEYHRMIEAGIFDENNRVELIEGELIEMAAAGGRHIATVNDLTMWFAPRLLGRAIVSIQNPVRLPHSEPEPDVALIRPRPAHLRTDTPRAEDVLLIIEVSDTTFGWDRGTKLPIYAAAGIPEVWIVDLERRRILVHRLPDGDLYREAIVIDAGALAPSAFPDLAITMDEIFG